MDWRLAGAHAPVVVAGQQREPGQREQEHTQGGREGGRGWLAGMWDRDAAVQDATIPGAVT